MNKLLALTFGAFALVFVGGGVVFSAVSYAQTDLQSSITDQIRTKTNDRLNEQKEAAQKKRAEIQAQAEAKLKEAQANKELRTSEVRQKACESRKSALANKVKATSAAAERHVATIDKFNVKLTGFVDKYSLNISGYGDKLTALQVAQVDATAAVATLKSVADTEINCEEIDAAATQAIAYQSTLKLTREAIQNYRMVTKDLLVAIKTSAEAKEAKGTESEGTESEGTESESATQEESNQGSTQETTDDSNTQESTN